jgi:RNA-binding protein NOB1
LTFILLQFTLPKPQGGKHACNPILVEDQLFAHQRMSKRSKMKYDVMDADYIANSSPFAPTDTTSRSALLGIRNHGHNFRTKRNPNENKKVYGRRK